jgi:hypothetical protein
MWENIYKSTVKLKEMALPQTLKVSHKHRSKKTLLVEDQFIAKYQLSPTCTLLASAREFTDHFLQTTIINGDKADSKILHLYLDFSDYFYVVQFTPSSAS